MIRNVLCIEVALTSLAPGLKPVKVYSLRLYQESDPKPLIQTTKLNLLNQKIREVLADIKSDLVVQVERSEECTTAQFFGVLDTEMLDLGIRLNVFKELDGTICLQSSGSSFNEWTLEGLLRRCEVLAFAHDLLTQEHLRLE